MVGLRLPFPPLALVLIRSTLQLPPPPLLGVSFLPVCLCLCRPLEWRLLWVCPASEFHLLFLLLEYRHLFSLDMLPLPVLFIPRFQPLSPQPQLLLQPPPLLQWLLCLRR